MAKQACVAYFRVSTAKQGKSGLGLAAQQQTVETFLGGGAWHLVGEPFVEVESGKRDDNRPMLQQALRLCRLTGATLIVAKLDRLSRNAAFLMTLRDSGVRFVAADMPDANSLTVGVMALIAQQERDAISSRTRAALAAAKTRGTRLGGNRGHALPHRKAAEASAAVRGAKALERAKDVFSAVEEARATGATSLRQLAAELTRRRIQTPRGSTNWHASQVRAVLMRLTLPKGEQATGAAPRATD